MTFPELWAGVKDAEASGEFHDLDNRLLTLLPHFISSDNLRALVKARNEAHENVQRRRTE